MNNTLINTITSLKLDQWVLGQMKHPESVPETYVSELFLNFVLKKLGQTKRLEFLTLLNDQRSEDTASFLGREIPNIQEEFPKLLAVKLHDMKGKTLK